MSGFRRACSNGQVRDAGCRLRVVAAGRQELAGDGEHAGERCGDVVGGYVGAQVSGRGARSQEQRDDLHELLAHPAVFDASGRHQPAKSVDHPVLRGRPLAEQRHPRPERLRRGLFGEQFARVRGEPLHLVLVDRLDERLAFREVPVQGADADARVLRDRLQRRLLALRRESPGRGGDQLLPVAAGLGDAGPGPLFLGGGHSLPL
jgi:hypothetical protein